MCGIGGILHEEAAQCDRAALERMSEAMRERGPDDHGEYCGAGIGLVHRRLSILDLSEAGRCPISNEDGSIQVVHNGEIYNFAQLRKELIDCGHHFRSRCDSEVVVHGYKEWGEGVIQRLEGMFATAIWDSARRRLILARDRFGKKPLYWLRRDRKLVFASTLNAIRAHEAGQLEVDANAMQCFLAHGFIPHPHTIWRGVESLPPAHYAVIENGGQPRLTAYWEFPDKAPGSISIGDAEDQVDEVLEESVIQRLVADVPVGGFLSGGVDSSVIMAMAAKHLPRLDTFSIGFEGQDVSELPYAKKVAEHIGSNHHELILGIDSIYENLPSLVWHYGQPFGDSSAVPTHLVSRLARESVKVSLSGDGGDESFAGYWRAESGVYADYFRRVVPGVVRRHGVPLAIRALEAMGRPHVGERLARLNQLASLGPGLGFSNNESWYENLEETKGDFLRQSDSVHHLEDCRVGKPFPNTSISVLRQILYDDFQVLLPDAYLVKVDVASMAASLEVRSPLLDHRLVELAWSLPDSMKLRGSRRKWLLKRVAARHVPSEVIYRPKQGFALPMQLWWASGLLEILNRLIADSRAAALGFIKTEPVHRAIADYRAGDQQNATRLWLVLWLELWVRIVLEGSMDRNASLRP